MLLKLIFLLVFGYFSSIFAVTSPKVANGEELYETFVDKYERYRQMAGCAAPLCNKTVGLQQPTTTTCPPGYICPAPKVEVGVISKCCLNCSCGDDCERDGTCCPDKLVSFPKHGKYHLGGVYDCRLTSVKENPKLGQRHRRMISHCDVNYKNHYVISLCEKSDPDSLEQYVPVFQTQTKEAYKNKFCAWCNFLDNDELQMWTIHLKCQDNAIFIYKNLRTLVPELRHHKKCNIVFEKPSNYNLPPGCEPLISTCNETGKWIQYDYFTEKACSAYSAPYIQNSKIYRNIFCFLCNMNERPLSFKNCSLSMEMGNTQPISISFAVILNFNEAIPELQQEAEEPESCSGATVYDHYNDKCREITCPELTEWYNGTCQWLFHQAKGLCFHATFRISFKHTATDIEGSQVPTQNCCGNEGPTNNCCGSEGPTNNCCGSEGPTNNCCGSEGPTNNCCGSQGPTNNCCGSQGPTNSCCDCKNICKMTQWAITNSIKAYFHQTFIKLDDYSIQTSPIIDGYVEVQTTFSQAITFVDTLVKLDGEKLEIINGSDWTIELSPFMSKTEIPRPDPSQSDNCLKTYTVSKFLHCALISLDQSEFDNNLTEIILKHSNTTLSAKDFQRINDTHISMCADDYLRFLPSTVVGIRKDPSSFTYIITLISLTCSIFSILSLIITIMVYIAFPALRTQPGINNLSLSISLLFAFIFLLCGSLQYVQHISILCITVGLISHFFWLNSMIWMNICCYHMFKSFGNMHTTIHKNLTQKYLAYSLIPTFLFIIVNIIYSEILNDGQSIGYGHIGNFCYILHANMILYTMTAPTNMVLISNLVLYLIVICRICRTPSVSRSTVKSRSNFTIYIKLSTFTGIAWFTYIPVMFTNSLLLELIFNTLVSLQGVFIMLAFVCNRRVMLFLAEKLRRKVEHNTSATTTRTTTSTVQHSSV